VSTEDVILHGEDCMEGLSENITRTREGRRGIRWKEIKWGVREESKQVLVLASAGLGLN
jgi:hypothetical protein